MANFGGYFGTISTVGLMSGGANINRLSSNIRNYSSNLPCGLNWTIITTQANAETYRYAIIECRPFLRKDVSVAQYDYTKKTHTFSSRVNGVLNTITTRSAYDFSANSSTYTDFYLRMHTDAVFYDSIGASYPEVFSLTYYYDGYGNPQVTKIGFYANFDTNGSIFGSWVVGSALNAGFEPIDITAELPKIPALTYTVTATAGTGGTISGGGTATYGSSKTVTITPNAGYKIANVIVNGSSVGSVSTYTFSNITANQSISATFSLMQYTVTTTVSGGGGTITPTNPTVSHGGSTTLTFTPNSGYRVDTVTLDGVSQGSVTSLVISNVTANRVVVVTFKKSLEIMFNNFTIYGVMVNNEIVTDILVG